MSIYAVYRTTDGGLFSTGSVAPTGLPAGLASKVFADGANLGAIWDTGTLAFVPRPLQARKLVTRAEYWRRFTPSELADIEEAASAESGDAPTLKRKKAEVRAGMRLWSVLDPLDVSAAYVTVPMTSIVQAGILTQSRAQAIVAAVME